MLVRIIIALLFVALWTGLTSAQAPAGAGGLPGAPRGAPPEVLEGTTDAGFDPLADRVPDSLDGMLAVALRTNPEVLQAEAKLTRAQADVNQARLKVIREVITSFHERKKLEESAHIQSDQLERIQKQIENGQVSMDTGSQARLQLTEAKARLAQVDAELRYMMGSGRGMGLPGKKEPAHPAGSLGSLKPPEPRSRPPIPERLEKLLNEHVSLVIEPGSDSLQSVCEVIGKTFLGGQTLVVDGALTDRLSETFHSRIGLKDVPLRDVLLAIADIFKVCFVLRDYGILVVAPEQAPAYSSPTIPAQPPDASPR